MAKILKGISAMMLISAFYCVSCTLAVHADYPIFYQRYTADPTMIEHDGRLYIYSSHDVFDPQRPGYIMDDITCISTDDMKNWTDHGEVCKAPGGWAGMTWAPSVAKRNGKFYLYFGNGGSAIGVAVSDSPTGPFNETHMLVDRNTPGMSDYPWGGWIFDPCTFVDDTTGQAYMYFGGNGEKNARVVKLKDNMIEIDGAVQPFGDANGIVPHFFEASFMHKYNGKYYFSYSADFYAGLPAIEYMVSDNPLTGFEYKGKVLPPPPENTDNNHHSIFQYKGEWYAAYHNKKVSILNGDGYGTDAIMYQRSIGIDRLEYNEDGTIKPVVCTEDGLKQLKYVNPYVRNEAETMAAEQGINTEANKAGGRSVNMIENGDRIKVRGIDFGQNGAAAFKANIASDFKGGSIELHLDSADGKLIGTLPVSYTGGEDVYREKMTNVAGAEGVHDLYLVFKGQENSENLFKIDSWKFYEKGENKTLIGVSAALNEVKIDKLDGGNTTNLTVKAIYSDDTVEDVTAKTEITTDREDIISIDGGRIIGKDYGNANINVSYAGMADNASILVKDLDSELIATKLTVGESDIKMIYGTTAQYSVIAEFKDGHTETVTDEAVFSSSDPEVAAMENGIITAKKPGKARITVSYRGKKGDTVTTEISVLSSANNPYVHNEVEAYQEQQGTEIEDNHYIGYVENGDWIKFLNVDFGSGAVEFETQVATPTSGGRLELHLDNEDGPLIGTVLVDSTGDWSNWVSKSCDVKNAKGTHDLYMKFVGGDGYLFNIDWWRFKRVELVPTVTSTVTDSKLKLSVSIASNAVSEVNVQVIYAIYDSNGVLKEIKTNNAKVEDGKTAELNTELDLPEDGSISTVKVFFWNSLNQMIQMANAWSSTVIR